MRKITELCGRLRSYAEMQFLPLDDFNKGRMNTRSAQRALNSIMGQGSRPMGEGGLGERIEAVMRIGSEYQAMIPEFGTPPSGDSAGTGSVLVWAPGNVLAEEDLDAFLNVAKDQFGYQFEQALGLLFWHRYNIEKAVGDLPNFCPLQDEWTMEDKVTFEQGFHFHGKNFQRIRAMLPEKPVSSLVKYYYLWKHTYSTYSLMDKHARKNNKRIIAGLPVNNDDTDSNKSGSSHSDLTPTAHFFIGKGKQLPKGIHLSTPEMATLASDSDHTHLKYLDQEISEFKDSIQKSKQELIRLKEEMDSDTIDQLRPASFTRRAGAPTRWSEDEIEVALEVIRKHGKDYEALANTLETKSISQCRNFFTNYKRKLNLPRLIAEYEIRHGVKHSRYSKQAREELLENGSGHVMMDGEVGMVDAQLGIYGPDITDHIPQMKRPRLGNGNMEAAVTL